MFENIKMAQKLAKQVGIKCIITADSDRIDFDGWVSIYYENETIKTLSGTRQQKSFVVFRSEVISGYPSEPDDVEEVKIGSYPSIWSAIIQALLEVKRAEIISALDSLEITSAIEENIFDEKGE